MNGFPWLTVIGAIPLAGALAIMAIPGGGPAAGPARRRAHDRLVKQLAVGFSLATLAVVIAMTTQFVPGGPRFQFTEDVPWIPQFGVHYALGVDGIALVLIGMSAVLMPVVLLASWNDVESLASAAEVSAGGPGGGEAEFSARTPGAPGGSRIANVKSYFALMLALETLIIGVFAATDVFLFYIFFEVMLVPMYFMIGSFGVGRRQYASLKFLLYNLLGGLLMLAAVIGLYVYAAHSATTGHHGTFLFGQLARVALDPTAQKWLFLGFFVAFAIKSPLWPLHTWLPDATAAAQPGAGVLMIGILDKVGLFGMIRYCLDLFPSAAHFFTPLVITLSVIAILYGAVVAIGQADIKRLIAYSSVSHSGFIALGIFAMTSQGQAGATFYMVNTGFATGALLILAGFLMSRRGSQRIADFGGVQKVAPVLAGLFLLSGLAMISLPGMSTFVSEFLVVVGTFTRYKAAAVLATIAMILAALYILWMYQRMMNGPTVKAVAHMPDLRPRELLAAVPLVALIVAMGVYPKPVLDTITPAVRYTMAQTRSADPLPAHPAAAGHAGARTVSARTASQARTAGTAYVAPLAGPLPLTRTPHAGYPVPVAYLAPATHREVAAHLAAAADSAKKGIAP
jgi:NADH-quinone oxidoreductase subunit M